MNVIDSDSDFDSYNQNKQRIMTPNPDSKSYPLWLHVIKQVISFLILHLSQNPCSSSAVCDQKTSIIPFFCVSVPLFLQFFGITLTSSNKKNSFQLVFTLTPSHICPLPNVKILVHLYMSTNLPFHLSENYV